MAAPRTPSQYIPSHNQSSHRDSSVSPMRDISPSPRSSYDGYSPESPLAYRYRDLDDPRPQTSYLVRPRSPEWFRPRRLSSTLSRRGPAPPDFGFEIELDQGSHWRPTIAGVDRLLDRDGRRRRNAMSRRDIVEPMSGLGYRAYIYGTTGSFAQIETPHISPPGELMIFTDASHAVPRADAPLGMPTPASIALAICFRDHGWYVQGRGIGCISVTTTAETQAITMAINFAVEYADHYRYTDHPLTLVTIVSDCLDVLQWVRRDFLAARNIGEGNQPLPQNIEFLSGWQLLLDRGIEVRLRWVRSHAGNLGNIAADRAAHHLRWQIDRERFEDDVLYWQWPPHLPLGANPHHLVYTDGWMWSREQH